MNTNSNMNSGITANANNIPPVGNINPEVNKETPDVTPQVISYSSQNAVSALRESFESRFLEYCQKEDTYIYLDMVNFLIQMIRQNEPFYVPIIRRPLDPQLRMYSKLYSEADKSFPADQDFVILPVLDERSEVCFPAYTKLGDLYDDFPGAPCKALTFMEIYHFFDYSDISCIVIRVKGEELEFWHADITPIFEIMGIRTK